MIHFKKATRIAQSLLVLALTVLSVLTATAAPRNYGNAQPIKVPKGFTFGRLATPSALRATNGKAPATAPNTTLRRQAPLRAPGQSTFYAQAVSDEYMGLISYTVNPAPEFKTYELFDRSIFNGGSTIKDGKLCGLYVDMSMQEYGLLFIWYGWFDLQTGEYDGQQQSVGNASLIALATATDPNTGEVFGEFYDNNMRTMEFGVANYDNFTRTKIATASQVYIAMGISSKSEAYGITAGGDLYHINRTTGAETRIGTTGIDPTGSDGMFYNQAGAIDPKTDIFYWACTDSTQACTIYSVSLTDAKATKVGDSPWQQLALNVMPPAADDKAPAAVSNLAINFEGPSTTGTISFTMPSTTFDGETPLTGELEYQIDINHDDMLTGTAMAGQAVSVELTDVEEGLDTFNVAVADSVGLSPVQTVTAYIGYDHPLPPTNVVLTASGAKATLTWKAPTATVNGGYLGNLTYNVYRYLDGQQTLARSGINGQEATFDINTTGALQNYTYEVEAVNHTQTSEPARSNPIVVGQALDVPYFDDFNQDINLYTVLDNNHDGATWTWDGYREAARYNYSEDNDADDWLVSPPFNLKANHNYVVSFKASGASTRFTERFELKWGSAPTAAGLANTAIGPTILETSEYKQFEHTVKPTEDGVYYFGIHATSDAAAFYIYIDSLSIIEGADMAAPAAVTNLKATPDQKGALKVTLTFNLPTTNVGGEALTEVNRVEVRKGEKDVIWTSTGALTPGQEVTMTDTAAVEGVNKYTVVPFNSAGEGLKSETSATAGLDFPNAPVVTAVDNQTSVKLVWDDITGVNGGVIDQSDVAFWIYSLSDENTVESRIGAVSGGTHEFTVSNINTDEGAQSYKWWAVRSFNVKGSSQFGKGKLLVGTPYALPYKQSFANGTTGDYFVDYDSEDKSLLMSPVTHQSADGDGGSLCISPSGSSVGRVLLGKVTPATGDGTVMKLSFKAPTPAPIRLEVVVKLPDGTESEALWSTNLSTRTSADWQSVSFELPAQLTSNRYIIPCIKVTASPLAAPDDLVYVDDIELMSTTAGIHEVEQQTAAGKSVYSLDGKLVSRNGKAASLRPGVYIVNGKKKVVGK